MSTDRFLDQVSLDNLHNAGRFVRASAVSTSPTTATSAGTGHGRTLAVRDREPSLPAGWPVRISGSRSTTSPYLDCGTCARSDPRSIAGIDLRLPRDDGALPPSLGDTPVTAAQQRRLSTLHGATRYTRVFGRTHVPRGCRRPALSGAGAFTMGSPLRRSTIRLQTDSTLRSCRTTSPAGACRLCSAMGASARISAASPSRRCAWRDDTGPRSCHDDYRFLVEGRQLQPRPGIVYRLPDQTAWSALRTTGTIRRLRTRTYSLSSSEGASRLAPASVQEALGGAYRPDPPERQNVYEVGYAIARSAEQRRSTVGLSEGLARSAGQQQLLRHWHHLSDDPAADSVSGVRAAAIFPPRTRPSGSFSATAGRAVSSPPFTGGLVSRTGRGRSPLLGPVSHQSRSAPGSGRRRLYEVAAWPWMARHSFAMTAAWCRIRPIPAEVAADPDFADLLPYVDFDADVPRVRATDDCRRRRPVSIWAIAGRGRGAVTQVTNLTNRTALYNFQSVFVGTRLVQPRTGTIAPSESILLTRMAETPSHAGSRAGGASDAGGGRQQGSVFSAKSRARKDNSSRSTTRNRPKGQTTCARPIPCSKAACCS